MQARTHGFTQPALDAVTDHRATERAGRGETDAGTGHVGAKAKGRKERPSVAEAAIVNSSEITRS